MNRLPSARTGRRLAFSVLAAIATVAAAQEQELSVGRTKVVVRPYQRGVAIYHDGVLVSRNSSMIVTTPPWTPHFYLGPQAAAVADATRTVTDTTCTLVMQHHGQHEAFVGTDTLRVDADGQVERTLHGEFTLDDGEALIQWRILALNPTLIVGRPYRAELADGSQRIGIVPVAPQPADASELAKNFRWIEFDSRIGPLRIKIDHAPAIICYDFRGSKWADPSQPYFWLGDLGTRFRKGQPIDYHITLTLPMEQAADVQHPYAQAAARLTTAPLAQDVDTQLLDPIVPRPKQATFDAGPAYVLATADLPNAVAPFDDDAIRTSAAAAFAELQRALHGYCQVQLGHAAQPNTPIRFAPLAADQSPHADTYELHVDADGIVLRSNSSAGFLYAVQSLRQLMTPLAGGVSVRAADVRDWPDLDFRGVHLFTGGQGPALHLQLLHDVLGPLKFNRLVLESEYIEWDCCPELHHPEYGMPKSDVRQILAAARTLGIEVIPLVMSLGHCQWMFHNGQHLDLAEDPDAHWAYCVTNPQTYDFIYQVYAEALELFQPRTFHIGHDEYADRGRVPYRESSQPYTPDELFVMDTLRHHAWFAERGVQMMMWGDMLLGPGEGPDACNAGSKAAAAELRAKLPHDIVIADWHYADVPPAQFNNLSVLHEAGFATVAATWYRPGNIVKYAWAAAQQHATGLLQTTWAGYSLDPTTFARELHQYAAYVLAADAAWNAAQPPNPADWLYGEQFLRLMRTSTLTSARHAGWTADLRGAYNYARTAADAAGWFALGPDLDLSALPHGLQRLRGILFDLGDTATPSDRDALVLYSKLARDPHLPAKVEVAINGHADQLIFLHATSLPCAPGELVGRYEVLREDGGRARIDLRYGDNVFAYTDLTAAAAAPIVWGGQTAAGTQIALRALVWQNPRPAQLIRAVYAHSSNATGSLIWLGLTGLQAAPASADAPTTAATPPGQE